MPGSAARSPFSNFFIWSWACSLTRWEYLAAILVVLSPRISAQVRISPVLVMGIRTSFPRFTTFRISLRLKSISSHRRLTHPCRQSPVLRTMRTVSRKCRLVALQKQPLDFFLGQAPFPAVVLLEYFNPQGRVRLYHFLAHQVAEHGPDLTDLQVHAGVGKGKSSPGISTHPLPFL